MNNTIQIFENEEFGAIRTMSDQQGQTWFCGRDVAEALGYKKPENALAQHVEKGDTLKTGYPYHKRNSTDAFHQRVRSLLPHTFKQVGECPKVQALGDERGASLHPQAGRIYGGKGGRERRGDSCQSLADNAHRSGAQGECSVQVVGWRYCRCHFAILCPRVQRPMVSGHFFFVPGRVALKHSLLRWCHKS